MIALEIRTVRVNNKVIDNLVVESMSVVCIEVLELGEIGQTVRFLVTWVSLKRHDERLLMV